MSKYYKKSILGVKTKSLEMSSYRVKNYKKFYADFISERIFQKKMQRENIKPLFFLA
jgi:hypothetical protein